MPAMNGFLARRPMRTRLVPSWCVVAALVCIIGASSGCIRQTLTVRSVPAGAEVFVDGAHVGQTPLDYGFSSYGTREVVLRNRGFQTHRQEVELSAPWYTWPVFDFVTEVIWPLTIEDNRVVQVVLYRSEPSSVDGLRARAVAEQLRSTKPR